MFPMPCLIPGTVWGLKLFVLVMAGCSGIRVSAELSSPFSSLKRISGRYHFFFCQCVSTHSNLLFQVLEFCQSPYYPTSFNFKLFSFPLEYSYKFRFNDASIRR